VTLGGQGQYVQLTSSNVSYAGSTFSFDVTVQNLIPQSLATTDGTTPAANGLRVFFASGPTVTSGSGAISVGNPDGVATFTAANQPYFEYSGTALGADGILSANETSSVKNWQLSVAPTVVTFSFQVYVNTEVQHPKGYVDVTTSSNNVSAGQTQTLTATVRTIVGATNSSAPAVTWASSNTSVATVNSSGQVTAVAPGPVTITATSDTLVGSANLQICPNLSSVGASYIVTGSSANLVCFSGGASAAAEYVAVPYNAAFTGSLTYGFTGAGIVAASGPPNPNRAPAGFRQALASYAAANALPASAAQRRMRNNLPPRTSLTRGRPAPGVSRLHAVSGPSSRVITPGVPTVGSTMPIDVALQCSDPSDIRNGIVRSVSAHAIVIEDPANPVGGFDVAQFDAIAAEFDTIAYPVIANNFAAPTDIDSNGHTVLFFTSAVNDLQEPADLDTYGGLFNSKDISSPVDCATSNFGELLYMAVPDPTGAAGDVRTNASVRAAVPMYLVHHMEHLVNAFTRAYVTGANFEAYFLDEALADEATELAFYQTSAGLAPRMNISATDITTGPNAAQRTASFQRFLQPNFARLQSWMQRPDTTGSEISDPARGVLWALLRYSSDRVGGADPAFWSGLVNSSLDGVANIDAAINDDLFVWSRDFTAALYADDAVPGVAAMYQEPSWNFRSIYGSLFSGFPLLTHPLTNGVETSIDLAHGAAAYLRFGVPNGGFARLTTAEAGGTPSSTLAVTIIRTK
jgi:hypothetical protein